MCACVHCACVRGGGAGGSRRLCVGRACVSRRAWGGGGAHDCVYGLTQYCGFV